MDFTKTGKTLFFQITIHPKHIEYFTMYISVDHWNLQLPAPRRSIFIWFWRYFFSN
jgi:hypothetical protein